MSAPLCIDLFCGLGGWTEGFLAEGFDVIGFDVERHVYGEHRYPGQLVLQDVRTLHGSQFRDALIIVASSPCTAYSYMAMPWSRAKQIAAALRGEGPFPEKYGGPATIAELNELFEQPARIQREASEAAGRYIPLIQENVKGAQPWVGRARHNFGSFYLWGDVPALMPVAYRATKVPGMNWSGSDKPGYKAVAFNDPRHHTGQKNVGGSWFKVAHNTTSGTGQNPDGRKVPGFTGPAWFNETGKTSSKSAARKAASARIAKIPFPLASHIARVTRESWQREVAA